MKRITTFLLAFSVIICATQVSLASQNRSEISKFMDAIYISSGNQNRKSNGRNNLDQMLQEAKKQAAKKKAEHDKIKGAERTRKSTESRRRSRDKNENKSVADAQGDVNAKREQDDIALVVNGEGPNKTEAIKNALRSAIEQAYGTFVSTNTSIVNDELVRDEIATVASGNIKSYREISTTQLPNGNTSVSLFTIVSIGKLVQYAQSHGGSAEFAGQTFMMNMRMRKLNKENEIKALEHLVEQLQILENDLFDYQISVGDPITKGEDNYDIPISLTILTNETYQLFQQIYSNTLSSLSLTESEILDYNSNKTIVTAYMPYWSGETTISRYTPIIGIEMLNDYFFLRNDSQSLLEINRRICAIMNNAQKSFRVKVCGEDNYLKTIFWTPSVNDISYVKPLSDDGYYLRAAALDNSIFERVNVNAFVHTNYALKLKSNMSYDTLGHGATKAPMGKGKVFAEISFCFNFGEADMQDIQGFEVEKCISKY